jgi:hypothetical protein
MTRSDVRFTSSGLNLAGHLYLPAEARTGGRKLPAVVLVTPCSGIKEQTAGLSPGCSASEGDSLGMPTDAPRVARARDPTELLGEPQPRPSRLWLQRGARSPGRPTHWMMGTPPPSADTGGAEVVDPAPQKERLGGGFGTGMSVVMSWPFCQLIENTWPPSSKP